jgi:hypothetical protein
MATGYKSGGIDFDDLFDPYVTGTPPAATGYRVAGVDLAGRYAPLVFGTQRADIGYRIAGGADVATLWAAKGTARYVSANCGLPANVEARAGGTSGPLTATASFNLFRDGTTSWSPSPTGSPSAWYLSPPPNIGDQYEARVTQTATNGIGTPSNISTGWVALSSTFNVILQATRPTIGTTTATRTATVEIRKIGEVTPAASHSINLLAEVDIS